MSSSDDDEGARHPINAVLAQQARKQQAARQAAAHARTTASPDATAAPSAPAASNAASAPATQQRADKPQTDNASAGSTPGSPASTEQSTPAQSGSKKKKKKRKRKDKSQTPAAATPSLPDIPEADADDFIAIEDDGEGAPLSPGNHHVTQAAAADRSDSEVVIVSMTDGADHEVQGAAAAQLLEAAPNATSDHAVPPPHRSATAPGNLAALGKAASGPRCTGYIQQVRPIQLQMLRVWQVWTPVL